MSVVVELERDLPGESGLVWELLVDWENQHLWMLEASDFRVLGERREGVGVEAEATIRIAGIRTRDRVRVSAWEPGRHLAIDHVGWVSGRGDLWLSPSGDRTTHLRWREELRGPWGLAGRIGLRLFRPLLVGTFRRDLDALTELVRARSAT